MLYAEASYFDGYHFHHIAAWEDAQRVKRRWGAAHSNALRNRRSGGRRG